MMMTKLKERFERWQMKARQRAAAIGALGLGGIYALGLRRLHPCPHVLDDWLYAYADTLAHPDDPETLERLMVESVRLGLHDPFSERAKATSDNIVDFGPPAS